ncbi:polysaccharide deacetylase family protein [Paenibacillus sediminis]|uniref:Peptidoglycan/xylan/chitin deacetylase (PgdA/CDA1 family) n=1 Tax=Paenibacillus sediminis TaxID=664909 RepID=A0ABS4GY47_9BACL|nr:polysaccharide deacetylase family protein [Paenibacillus sediminis]MBP1935194.1 peptidoglycan/xylan/chitin deacetylase (PgdA/CDA1 family) [Paenibacillus sediminis]
METLMLWIFYITSFYAFIPGMMSRLFGFRVFKKGKSAGHFALTFDDGPDPRYTPLLLDLLKKYDAKATFFVVGAHAEKNPDLIKRIHDEGHLLGVHNYLHKTNWLMRPATVKKHIKQTRDIIHSITGNDTPYYRPPWGIVNLFDIARKRDVQIVLWSRMFSDWRSRVGADRLTKRMLKKLRGGEVFLLHDCGTTVGANQEAPEQMLIALERVLEEANRKGLQSVRIDKLMAETESYSAPRISLFKRLLVLLWLQWEKVFHAVFHLHTINPEDPMYHIRVRTYHGQPTQMDNGSTLVKGDKIIELHLDNKKLFEIGSKAKSTVHLAIQMIRGTEKTLPVIAQYVLDHPEISDVKALYGVSMIHRGPEQFGFKIIDLPKGMFSSFTQLYLKLLLRVIHPAGQKRLKHRADQLVPKMILMPIDVLIGRFSQQGSSHRSHVEKDEVFEHTSDMFLQNG